MSFKVLCLKQETKECNLSGRDVKPCKSKLVIGNEYNVVLLVDGPKGKTYYGLEEIAWPDVFNSDLFARLGGPDERERLEAYQREQLAMEGKLFEGVAAILAEEEKMPQDVWERNWSAIEERLNAGR